MTYLPSPLTFLALPILFSACWALVALAYRDLSRRRLPNAWVGVYTALFPLFAWVSGIGWTQAGWHVIFGLAASSLAVLLFALGKMGGGDVKLWGAVMLWAGPQGAITALVMATLCGSLLGVLGWLSRGILRRKRKPIGAAIFRMLTAARGVPYGVALAIAGIHTLVVAGL